ncbi:MAG: tryptophan synthase subunit alpha [Thiomicrorhabdus chilensis]|uniref:tryptophan synthase subunit alpha n=1 Tax=Thiomicrorhabdus chilensis TaxID=63656 RepID=UPI00040183F0|nr:tryptophan synthase subunit alpha [Thiomicrorhabdus chilensis]MDX1346846.1 tryptophan synthase subunit alpha [Thiomicrorhabdus chilensis]
MSRIQKKFEALKAQGKTALIPYITAGDPNPNATVSLMHLLVSKGADMIELGVPFSDPMADGPVIQKAVERALKHNVSLDDVLEYVRVFREQDEHTPVILMGYLNPIEAEGYEAFSAAAQSVGVDAVLTVDMPPEESMGYLEALQGAGLDRVYLVSPTTPESRLAAVNEKGSGFVYYVSLKGVTGSSELNAGDVAEQVNRLRGRLSLPIGIGFGIRNGEAAFEMAQLGDAVIVGSALVSLIEANAHEDLYEVELALGKKMTEFRAAIDRADAQ